MADASLGRIGVIEFTPVIYTGTSGGGDDEYHGSNDPDTPAHHIIDAPIPPGALSVRRDGVCGAVPVIRIRTSCRRGRHARP